MIKARETAGREEPDEEHLRLLFEAVTDYAIFTTDPPGCVVTWNTGAQRILGYEEAEILGQNASIFFTPEDIRLGEPERELRTAATKGRAEDERWHLRKDGSRFWASGVVTPLHDEVGRHRGFGKVMRDITERKRMEDELIASEARFRSIAEQSPVLIWRSAVDGGYDYFNRPWYDFRGRGPDQELASGFAWAEGIHPEDRPLPHHLPIGL